MKEPEMKRNSGTRFQKFVKMNLRKEMSQNLEFLQNKKRQKKFE